VNTLLNDKPEKINESPLDDGWILRAEPSDPEQVQDLLNEEAYTEFVGSL
jgi:glycine cleavage system H protein